jgi:translocation and assembly module TamB
MRARLWLLGGLALLLGMVAIAVGVCWWAVGTEPGTRWLVGQALGYTEANVEIQEPSGTLWHGLQLGRVKYADDDRRIELHGFDLELDWSASTMTQVAISRLRLQQVSVTSAGETEPASEPLSLDIPPLPVSVSVATLDIASVDIDGVAASDIEFRDLGLDGLRVRVASAAAVVDVYELRLDGLDAELRDDVPLRTGFSWVAADIGWSGDGIIDGSLRHLNLEHDLYGDYPMRSRGTVDLSAPAEPTIDVVSTFEEWRYEEWIARDAIVRLFGTMQDYQSELALTLSDGGQMSAQVRGEFAGNESGLTSVDLTVDALGGSARVTGNAQWSPATSADLAVSGTNVDVSSLTGGFATNLDWDLRLVAADAERFSIEISRLAGSYNDQPLLATGTASRDGEEWRCRGCDAAIGDNRLQVDLSLRNRRLNGAIDIDAPSLDQLYPGIAGSLRAEGMLRGSVELPVLSGNLAARELMAQGWSIGALTIDTHSATTEKVDVEIELDDLAKEGTAFGGGDIRVTGGLDQLNVQSRWATEVLSVEYAASVTRHDDTLTGRILSGAIDQSDTGAWTLDDPFDFIVTPDRFSVDSSRWSNGDSRLNIGRIVRGAESMDVEIALSAAPLRWLDGRTPSEVTFGGFIDARVELQQSEGIWAGQLDWLQRDTVLRFDGEDGDRFGVAVPVAEAHASLGPSGVNVRARLEADGRVEVRLDGTATGLSPEATVSATLSASGQEWDWVSAFIPEIEEIAGAVQASFSANGRLDGPQLNGELKLLDGSVVLPTLNVPVTDINVRVSGDSSTSLKVSGKATAGSGDLSITGEITDLMSLAPQLVLEIQGDEATVLDWPDYALVASPNLSLSGDGQHYVVDGRVRLDRAEILVRELPEGAVTPSSDVAVIGREDLDSRATRLTGAIDIELAESVHVRAFGLDTNLEGGLRITLPDGREPRANGEVTLVGGFFEMYGQRLEIERGTMLFSGALDNPFVDVRVVRSIDGDEGTIIAGMDIRGRADALASTLYSDPAMSEAEVLSYLVTGRPLTQASSVDGQLMGDAAFSLGLRQASAITNQIGQSVGLDELALEGANQDAAALVAGKQISPNLYARYRYGVFSSLGELLLRYSLTESLSVELGTGEFQSLDIQYTIERE